MQQPTAKSVKAATRPARPESKQASSKAKRVPSSSVAEGSIVHWLGGNAHIKQEIQSDFDVIKISMDGITKGSIDALTEYPASARKVWQRIY